jgi:hypothetical protein
MRRPIATVPRDGESVILEDDSTGTYELAHWSAIEGAWVAEKGMISSLTPTHWHAIHRPDCSSQQKSSDLKTTQSSDAHSPSPPVSPSTGPVELHLPPAAQLQFDMPAAGRDQRQLAPAAQLPRSAPSVSIVLEGPLRAEVHHVVADGPVVKAGSDCIGRFELTDEHRRRVDNPYGSKNRRMALSALGSIMVVGSLMGMYFRDEIEVSITRPGLQIATMDASVQRTNPDPAQESEKITLSRPDIAFQEQSGGGSTAAALSQTRTIEPVKMEIERPGADAQKTLPLARQETVAPLEQPQQSSADVNELKIELANTRRDLEAQVSLSREMSEQSAQYKRSTEAMIAELQQTIEQERGRIGALARETTLLKRELQSTQAYVGSDGVISIKNTTQSALAELQRNLEQERDKGLELRAELAKARRDLDSQAALLSETSKAVAQYQQTLTATADPHQPGQQQANEKLPLLENELVKARRDSDQAVLTRETSNGLKNTHQAPEISRPSSSGATNAFASGFFGRENGESKSDGSQKSVSRAKLVLAGTESSRSNAKRDLEAERLIERANLLMARRFIGAARSVLARAATTGSAEAVFRLAETYDPIVLSSWKATRTRSNAKKAGELYAQAYEGGIKPAKDRSEALRRMTSTPR